MVLERAPDENLLGYFDRELRLRLPKVRLLSHQSYLNLRNDAPGNDPILLDLMDELADHNDAWLDGFVTDLALEHLAGHLDLRTISSRRAIHRGNNKYLLHQHLANNGLPVFDTRIEAGISEVANCLSGLRDQGYRTAAIKAHIGASGIGIIRVNTDDPSNVPRFSFSKAPACCKGSWMRRLPESGMFVHRASNYSSARDR